MNIVDDFDKKRDKCKKFFERSDGNYSSGDMNEPRLVGN